MLQQRQQKNMWLWLQNETKVGWDLEKPGLRFSVSLLIEEIPEDCPAFPGTPDSERERLGFIY